MRVIDVWRSAECVHRIGHEEPEAYEYSYEIEFELAPDEGGVLESMVDRYASPSESDWPSETKQLLGELEQGIHREYPGEPSGEFICVGDVMTNIHAHQSYMTGKITLHYSAPGPTVGKDASKNRTEIIGECEQCGDSVRKSDDWIGGKALYCNISCLNADVSQGG